MLTEEALTQPYAAVITGEEHQIKTLSTALKEMMRRELLDGEKK